MINCNVINYLYIYSNFFLRKDYINKYYFNITICGLRVTPDLAAILNCTLSIAHAITVQFSTVLRWNYSLLRPKWKPARVYMILSLLGFYRSNLS